MRFVNQAFSFLGRVLYQFTVKCSYCGNEYDKDANRYCPKCGHSEWTR